MMQKQLLLIDADPLFRKEVCSYFSVEAFKIDEAEDGEEGLKKALNDQYDVIILDIMLSHHHGFDILEDVRKYSDVPMVFLTSFDTQLNHWLSLFLGADDYLAKPCHPCDLILRVQSILNRKHQVKVFMKPSLEFQGIQLDCAQRKAFFKGIFLDLTNTELNILEVLLKSPEQVFSKQELTEYAMGRKFTAYDRSIDVHISHLRAKLKYYKAPHIKTIRGFGYALYAK